MTTARSPQPVAGDLERRAVLLLDSDGTRLQARGAAMRSRGANVVCSQTVLRARNLWSPGSHQLVLIDFQGGGPEFDEFYRDAAAQHPRQAFAFYSAERPFLTTEVPSQSARRAAAARPPATLVHWGNSIAEACQRIAAIRPLPQAPRAERAGSASPRRESRDAMSFSDAVKAAERAAKS